jgi:hypothetical protein
MKIHRLSLVALTLVLVYATVASAQDEPPPNPAGVPPKVVLLVRQEFAFGKAAERRKLEIAAARAYEQWKAPTPWIELESLTGSPHALFFDPLDSFEELDEDSAAFGQLFTAHPELARMQEQIEALLVSQTTQIAVRRDDLGYRPQSIDLSKARYLRVLEVHLHPGYESEFVEAFKILSEGYERLKADTPWVVYQVNVGAPAPAFLVFVPMRVLAQNDDLLYWRRSLREAEGEEAAGRMDQITKDAYASTESNLYVISPEMSHVPKEFAEGNPEFWSARRPAAPKPPAQKDVDAKPKP